MTKCQFGVLSAVLASYCHAAVKSASCVCFLSPTPTSDCHGDVPSQRGVGKMSGLWLILSVCVRVYMEREVKSRWCRSSSLPFLYFNPTRPPHPIPFFLFFLSLFLLLPLSFVFSLFSVLSPKHVSGCTVWSCHSLKSPDRNPACSCSPVRHCDICIRWGRSVGLRVQVSSLTGSCPYLVWVAPSDRLKVSVHLIYIDYKCLFYFIFLLDNRQW